MDDGLKSDQRPNKQNNQKKYTKLVFSGGSTHAFAFIGCVRKLEEKGSIGYIQTVGGASAGALIALMLVLGMSSLDMQTWACDKLADMRANQLDIDDVLDIYASMGLDKGVRLAAFMNEMIFSRMQRRDVTFAELHKLTNGKASLLVCASNLTTSSPEYFSHLHTPNVSVITAIRASMCLPVFFSPVIINGMMYSDGGLFENLPIRGVLAMSPSSYEENGGVDVLAVNIPWDVSKRLPTNIVDYAMYMVTSLLRRANAVAVESTNTSTEKPLPQNESRRVELIDIDNGEENHPFLGFCLDSMEFVIDKKMVERYVRLGYESLGRLSVLHLC